MDAAVRRILSVRFRLGEFDPPERNPYAAITADVINCAAHQELAREAARASVVLLQNERRPAAADRDAGRVAVLGPLGRRAATRLVQRHPAVRGDRARRPGRPARRGRRSGSPRASTGSRCAPTAGARSAADDGGAADRAPAPADRASTCSTGAPARSRCAPAANGRYVGADDDGVLVNDRPGPGRLVVRETFELVRLPATGVALRHVATGRYVTRRRRRRAARRRRRPASGPPAFTVDLVDDGAGRGGRGGRATRTSRSWCSATTRWSTAGRPRTARTWPCRRPRRRCCARVPGRQPAHGAGR